MKLAFKYLLAFCKSILSFARIVDTSGNLDEHQRLRGVNGILRKSELKRTWF